MLLSFTLIKPSYILATWVGRQIWVKDSGYELAICGLNSISLFNQHGVMIFYVRLWIRMYLVNSLLRKIKHYSPKRAVATPERYISGMRKSKRFQLISTSKCPQGRSRVANAVSNHFHSDLWRLKPLSDTCSLFHFAWWVILRINEIRTPFDMFTTRRLVAVYWSGIEKQANKARTKKRNFVKYSLNKTLYC